MSAVVIQQMVDRVAALMEQRLNVRGRDLPEKLKRGGRRLPRKVRHAAELLSQAGGMAQNPRLLLQMDHEKVAQAYDVCVRHLNGLNRWDRRMAFLLTLARSTVFVVVAVGLIVYAVLKWRGFV